MREGKDASVETRALSSVSDSGGLSVKTHHLRQRHGRDLLSLERFARSGSAVVCTNKKHYCTPKIEPERE